MNTVRSTRRQAARWTVAAVAAAAIAGSLAIRGAYSAEGLAVDVRPAPVFEVPGSRSFADVIEQVSPAVVNISVTKLARVRPTAAMPDSGRAIPFDEFFGRFFGMPGLPDLEQGQPRSEAQGSGFIIDGDGLVATNYHVVEGAEVVTVTLPSGDTLDATVIGQDPQTDLALLHVDSSTSLPAVEFGDSDRMRVGDWVLAIGNPFGLGGSATAGIISARGRDIASGPYDDYLQIDAPINHGNSGGPIFNAAGEVVGINTAIVSPNGGNIGIGFAIPSNQASRILTELQNAGTVSRGWLGVQIQPLDDALASALGIDEDSGVLVSDVVAASPAERAGIRAGDVVASVDGQPVDSPRELARMVGGRGAGDRVELAVLRDGRERTVRVQLGESVGDARAATRPSASGAPSRSDAAGRFGLDLEDLTPERKADLGLDDLTSGALVSGVRPGSAAALQGIQPGDVIVAVNREPTDTAAAAAAELGAAGDDGSQALVLIRRGDVQRFVALKAA